MIDYKSVGLSEEDLKEIYKWMDLGRKVDERLWLLNRAGKIPLLLVDKTRGYSNRNGLRYERRRYFISIL